MRNISYTQILMIDDDAHAHTERERGRIVQLQALEGINGIGYYIYIYTGFRIPSRVPLSYFLFHHGI